MIGERDIMYTEKIAENIYRIPVKLPYSPLKELNSYLIKDPSRSLLIDTGFHLDACRDALLQGFAELDTDPRSVNIFLTHMHSDHSGLAADIIGESMRIFISETDNYLLNTTGEEEIRLLDEVAAHYRDADLPAFIIENMRKINPAIAFSNPENSSQFVSVHDGQIVRAGGYELRCISTPGHSPGHMCLWEEGSGYMFTGDHVLFDITPNITAWPFVRDSLGDYLDSLRSALKYPVKKALPGHRASGDHHARVGQLLAHHKARLAEIEKLIREAPGATAYEISGKMLWKIRADSWEEFPPAQKIFAVGECISHLDYLTLRGRIIREKDGTVSRYFS